ncbi:hypothetical protein D3OALGA1CA_2296 [Olavius algarvensis associated proteobacterium Delta 3]|nr:hypothetical protein D3OALGB2SA_197 [Olavius algarvensis associated proteobacterium Delta 3]CAB5116527.1 hypothetical protein D3OALGA1CA_2296 [Olavius algarvensis associated proteobacterium Delta 3]
MKSIEKIVEEQIRNWQIMGKEETKKEPPVSVITISRDPGSGGNLVGKGLAWRMEFDLFHQEVLHEMAKSASVNSAVLETLDEKGISMVEDWIQSLVNARHLWPDRYLKHLMRIIGAIGKHGRAVIIGRGANFILPPEKTLRVRVVAPRKIRVRNVARDFHVSKEKAMLRVIRAESDRQAFIRKYFHADIADPVNYDLLINTEKLSIDQAVKIIHGALKSGTLGGAGRRAA